MNMSERKMSLLVTGAAGWIGRQVCAKLQARGCRVAAYDLVAGDGPWDEAYVGGLDDLAQPSAELRRLLGTVATVIHCAGRAHRPVETAAEVALFERTNVVGTRDLLNACRANGVTRIVYVSTIAGYDWDTAPAGGVSETAVLRARTAYARTKLEAERLVAEAGLDWRAVRLATVFGAGDRANFSKLAGALRRGRFVVPGPGTARKSVIPVELAAEVLVRLALLDEPKQRLMNVALPEAPTLREICDTFSAECGFSRARSVSLRLLRAAALVGNVAALLRPNFPLTTVNLRKLTTSTVVDPSRLYETLPEMSWPTFAEALRPAVEYYRAV
jgi:nucleoside-diphosphate-sugar epimerase